MKEFPIVQLDGFFLLDAADLVAARDKSRIIHRTKDIDASGDEVEIAARSSLQRHLPNGCHVSHGHVIDSSLRTSPQLDVIISDASVTPVLFRAQNETEYLPIESIFAIGEIKSTYNKTSKPIQSFVSTITSLKSEFQRKPAPPTYLQTGGRGVDVEFIEQSDKKLQNPLFTFMLFVDSGDFSPEDVAAIYCDTKIEFLPSIVCLLDKGLIVYGGITEKGFGFVHSPEAETKIPDSYDWAFFPLGEDAPNMGAHYGFLCYTILAHIQESVLLLPKMQTYLGRMFVGRKSKTVYMKQVNPLSDSEA